MQALEARQLFAGLTSSTGAQPTGTSGSSRPCAVYNLPIGGVLSLPGGEVLTLTAAGSYKPACTPVVPPAIIANGGGGSVTIDETDTVQDRIPVADSDPFYASTFPQCYALAATTVVAYTLVIMLLITPRSFLNGGVVVLGRRGFTNGGSGPSIGGRPWLQKVAALTVAISLTIASAATFDAAERQYRDGYQDARALQAEVLGGNELKIIRIISNTFLWLAQAQTLIRLFPRHREKVIIKWTAFALIILDIIFQSLNCFHYPDPPSRPGFFKDAVPALSYLFALSLSVLYAAWVIYYSLIKKRYAFWHPQMKNMCLVAALSLLSLLIPVVFFILDISKPEFTGWGEYVRWVGAAAASVIVWEWVERIEALEREEKKDCILGREVFDDGDETWDMAYSESNFRKRRKRGRNGGDNETGDERASDSNATAVRGSKWPCVASLAARYRSRSRSMRATKPSDPSNTQSSNHDRIRPPLWPARPAAVATPISRADTASAASTVYAVRYHSPLTDPPPQVEDTRSSSPSTSTEATSPNHEDIRNQESGRDGASRPSPLPENSEPSSPTTRLLALTRRLPFTRGHQGNDEECGESNTPPTEQRQPKRRSHRISMGGSGSGSKWDIRSRLEEFAAAQAERLREKLRPTPDTDSLPVTIIPAPPRPGAALAEVLREQQQEQEQQQREREQEQSRQQEYFRGGASTSSSNVTTRSISRLSPVTVQSSIPLRSIVTPSSSVFRSGGFETGSGHNSHRVSLPAVNVPLSPVDVTSTTGLPSPTATGTPVYPASTLTICPSGVLSPTGQRPRSTAPSAPPQSPPPGAPAS